MTLKYIKNRSGTSLMEVLVVMVVLVIGILVVLRMFPVGFRSLSYAENVSIAGRLAQAEMEKWKNRSTNLPEGILPIDTNGNLDLDCLPGPPLDDKNPYYFRRIIGETTKIPVGTYSSGGSDVASVYVLGFSPIQVILGSSGSPTNFSVYGGSMRGIRMDWEDDENEPWRWLRTQYAIDYSNGKICLPRPPAGVSDYYYHISLSYRVGAGSALQHKIGNIVKVTTADEWIDIITACNLPAGAAIDEGSEVVARAFRYLDASVDWTSDPYEYKLRDSVVGIVAFNPRGYEYQETTEYGTRPLEARIDYYILDHKIMSEEKTVPSVGPYTVKLTLPFIKEKYAGASDTGVLYPGLGDGNLVINFNNGGTPVPVHPDVLVVNPSDGAKLLPRSGDTELDVNPSFVIDEKGFKTGTITFASKYVTVQKPDDDGDGEEEIENNYDISGKTLRFYYQADGDWSVQLQKAYESYTEQDFADPYDIDYRRFMRDTTPDLRNRLYFKRCDSEKTVVVNYKWSEDVKNTPGDPKDDVVHVVNGENHRISADWVGVSPMFCYIYLNHGAEKTGDSIKEITSVTGISIKARTLWRQGKRWRYVDLDSSLTRRPSEL